MRAPNFKGIPIGGDSLYRPSRAPSDGMSLKEWRVIFILSLISFVVLRMRFLQETRNVSLKYENSRPKGSSFFSPNTAASEAGSAQLANKWSIQSPPAHVSHAPLLKTMILPPVFHYFANVTHLRAEGEIPFFWSIPSSGSGTVQHIIAACLGLTLASDASVRNGHHAESNFLQILWIEGKKYVNVDLSTTEGIGRAKALGLIESKMQFVLVSPQLYDVASLVDNKQIVRMFTMMRNPVERAVSHFYWTKMHDKNFSKYSLRDFYLRPEFIGNWVTRTLVNKITGTLYLEDLDLAKHILKEKCLVGLLTQKAASMERFEKYFGWEKLAGVSGTLECEERSMFWDWKNKNDHPNVEEGSEEYQIISTRNEFDMELFAYATELFVDQGRTLDKKDELEGSAEKLSDSKAFGVLEETSASLGAFLEEDFDANNETTSDNIQTMANSKTFEDEIGKRQ